MSRRLVLTRLCTCEGRTVYTWSHGVRSIHFSSILATAVARFIRFTGEAASHHSLINSFVRGKIDTKTFILYPPLKRAGIRWRCNKLNREKEGYVTTRNRKYIKYLCNDSENNTPIKISHVRGRGRGRRGTKGGGLRTARFLPVQYLNYIRTRKTCNTS